MAALLYFATAALTLWLAHRFVTPLSVRAAAFLLLVPLCFTGRALLTGRVYAPIDIPWVAQPLADHRGDFGVKPPQAPMLSDNALEDVPWREALRFSLARRDWPLLNRFEACGDPLAGSSQPAPFNPFTLIATLLPAALSMTLTASIAFLVAGLGAFLLARELGRSELASAAAAAIWAFSTAISLQILWPLGLGWALLAFLLMATKRTAERPSVRSAAILTTALALVIVAGHPESMLHVIATGCVFGIFELLRQHRSERLRAIAFAVGAGVVALLLTAIFLLPVVDTLQQTRDYVARSQVWARIPFRVAPGHVFAALVSDAFPFLRDGLKFDSVSARSEAGSLALALAAYAVIRRRSAHTWFFGGLLVFGLLVGADAWPLAHLLHEVPLFGWAINNRMAALVPLCLAALSAYALDDLPRRGAAVAFTAVLLLSVAAAVIGARSIHVEARGAIAEVVPLALAATVVMLPLRREWLVATLIALILVQRTAEEGMRMPVLPQAMAAPHLALFKPLESIAEPFRITAGYRFLPNNPTMYHLEDVRSSSPIPLKLLTDTYPLWLTQKRGMPDAVLDLTRPILSMMNVRFAVQDVSDPIPPGWRDRGFDVYTRLIENERALPRAFVPRSVRFGFDDAGEIAQMAAESDFAERAWLDAPLPPGDRTNGPGRVESRWESSRKLALDAAMDGAGFVVISQAAWDGWRAYLDGQRVEVHRANHAFLAVYVPAGRHRVSLQFLPQSFVVGRTITVLTIVMLLLFGLVRKRLGVGRVLDE